MTVFTFMIMNVGAVMYLCVTDVVARTLVTYSCSRLMEHAENGNISGVFVTAVWGVESDLSLDIFSHLGEEIFRSHLLQP